MRPSFTPVSVLRGPTIDNGLAYVARPVHIIKVIGKRIAVKHFPEDGAGRGMLTARGSRY